jgi:hypothetical protein
MCQVPSTLCSFDGTDIESDAMQYDAASNQRSEAVSNTHSLNQMLSI